MKKSILFLAGTVLLFSCQKQPSADFNLSKTEVNSGEEVKCTNTSLEADHYKWTFPDGNTLTSKDATVIWKTPETVNVKLEAFSKNGKKTDEVTKSFKVKNYNELFVGTFIGNTNLGCGLDKITNTVLSSDRINMDLDGAIITAKVTDATSGVIDQFDESDSNGHTVYTGTIKLSGNSLSVSLHIVYTDFVDPSADYIDDCTSVLSK